MLIYNEILSDKFGGELNVVDITKNTYKGLLFRLDWCVSRKPKETYWDFLQKSSSFEHNLTHIISSLKIKKYKITKRREKGISFSACEVTNAYNIKLYLGSFEDILDVLNLVYNEKKVFFTKRLSCVAVPRNSNIEQLLCSDSKYIPVIRNNLFKNRFKYKILVGFDELRMAYSLPKEITNRIVEWAEEQSIDDSYIETKVNSSHIVFYTNDLTFAFTLKLVWGVIDTNTFNDKFFHSKLNLNLSILEANLYSEYTKREKKSEL